MHQHVGHAVLQGLEAADGRATLEWISQQPWFNGSLGAFGSSYPGYAQWAIAAGAPPYLKAMVLSITTSNLISAFFPGLIGTLYFFKNGNVEPDDAFRFQMSLEILVMVMLGGFGTVIGPVISKTVLLASANPAASFRTTRTM